MKVLLIFAALAQFSQLLLGFALLQTTVASGIRLTGHDGVNVAIMAASCVWSLLGCLLIVVLYRKIVLLDDLPLL